MIDSSPHVLDLLAKQFQDGQMDVIDLIPVPKHGDRMVRLQTLEAILDEFDRDRSDDTSGYFVKVCARTTSAPSSVAQDSTSLSLQKLTGESIYRADGQLNTSFLLKNAELLFQAGDYHLARNIYHAVLQSGERTASALLGVALCYEKEGKIDEARMNFEESIAYHPAIEAYQSLVSLLANNGMKEQAAMVVERALNLKDLSNHQRVRLHFECAGYLAHTEKLESAEKHLVKTLEIDPHFDPANTELGNLLLRSGRVREAQRHFQNAVAAHPKNDRALTGLGCCSFRDGDKRTAHDYFSRALDIDPRNPSALVHLVQCAYELKSFSTATRFMEKFIEFAPENTDLLYSLAGLQFHLGKLDEARVTVNRILNLAPTHQGARELSITMDRFANTAMQPEP